jgi:hypothetical protein
MHPIRALIGAAALAALAVGPAHAGLLDAIPTTGSNVIGGVDQNWSVATNSLTGTYSSAYSVSASNAASYAWAANGSVAPNATWISPFANGDSDSQFGSGQDYYFQTTFTLTASEAATATGIFLQTYSDDTILKVYLNGQVFNVNTTDTNSSNSWQTELTITDPDLLSTVNVLDIEVSNVTGGGPTGLQLTGEISVPEPTILALLGVGMLGLGAVHRRRPVSTQAV